jgi:hypothetical protein
VNIQIFLFISSNYFLNFFLHEINCNYFYPLPTKMAVTKLQAGLGWACWPYGHQA